MPHVKEKHPGISSISEYCLSMSKDEVWGTDIEILAASTLLQIPIYIFSNNNPTVGSDIYPCHLQIGSYVTMSSRWKD